MNVQKPNLFATPPLMAAIAQATAPAPTPAPVDTVQTTPTSTAPSAPTVPTPPPAPVPPNIDLGKVFDKQARTAKPPAELASFTYEAPASCSIDETVRMPDGASMVIARSFDSSNTKKPRGYVTCFNPDGSIRFTFTPPRGKNSREQVESHLLLADATSYAVTRGDQAWDNAHLVALDATGTTRWTWTADDGEKIDSVRPTPDGGVMAKVGDTIVGLAADGREKWRKDLPIHTDPYFHVVAADGTQIFVNDNFSMNFGSDSFCGVTPDGKTRTLRFPQIESFPLQLGDRLVYGGADGTLQGVDLGPKHPRWEVQTSSERGLKTPYTGPDGNIYVEGRHDDRVYAVSPDGHKLWEREISDAAPRESALDDLLRVAPDGRAYYVREGGDKIARIEKDGRPGPDIPVPEGVESLRVGPDGKLHIWTSDASLVIHDVDRALSSAWPVDVESPHLWSIKDVLPNGDVVFEGQDRIHHLHLNEQEELKDKLDQITSGEAPPPPPAIEVGNDWVVIGGVRVPVRRS